MSGRRVNCKVRRLVSREVAELGQEIEKDAQIQGSHKGVRGMCRE